MPDKKISTGKRPEQETDVAPLWNQSFIVDNLKDYDN